jgi:hypothetical protein
MFACGYFDRMRGNLWAFAAARSHPRWPVAFKSEGTRAADSARQDFAGNPFVPLRSLQVGHRCRCP